MTNSLSRRAFIAANVGAAIGTLSPKVPAESTWTPDPRVGEFKNYKFQGFVTIFVDKDGRVAGAAFGSNRCCDPILGDLTTAGVINEMDYLSVFRACLQTHPHRAT